MAGWWIWGTACWIGAGWCSGQGPWIVGADGRIAKRSGGVGVSRQLPHLGNNGQGVNHAGAREPGVSRQLPHLSSDGRGVNRPQAREPGVSSAAPAEWREEDFHPMTMSEVRRWFAFLSARLRHVRILNGDWSRSVTTGAAWSLPVRQGGHAGIFVDPPYADTADRAEVYAHDSFDVAHKVREWALEAGKSERNRIVLAGYDGEHGDAFARAGWREVEWFSKGFLKGGMAQQGADGHQQGRERLWCSPHCLAPSVAVEAQGALNFGG
jgi:hypothetical protein